MKKVWLSGVVLGWRPLLAGVANAQIKMGVAGPITGPNAAFGAQLKNGKPSRRSRYHAAGGILGKKISALRGRRCVGPQAGRPSPSPASATA